MKDLINYVNSNKEDLDKATEIAEYIKQVVIIRGQLEANMEASENLLKLLVERLEDLGYEPPQFD